MLKASKSVRAIRQPGDKALICSHLKIDGDVVACALTIIVNICCMAKSLDNSAWLVQASARKGVDMALLLYIRFKLVPFVAQLAFTLFNLIAVLICFGVLYLLFT